MWPGTANSGAEAKSAGIRTNPRRYAGLQEKCPTAYTVGHSYWWRRRESNPRPQTLYRPVLHAKSVFNLTCRVSD